MKNNKNKILVGMVVVLFIAVGGYAIPGNKDDVRDGVTAEKVTVFYSPTCGCCGNYIAYLKQKDYAVETVRKMDLSGVKAEYGIPRHLESCHTSVVGDYVVEGHIPVEVVEKLLVEKPEIAGIALAGMPSGSPGMGGGKREPFQIHAIVAGGNGGIFMEF